MKSKVILIDGHNYLFKGFYGVPCEAKMHDDTPINAVYGFFALARAVATTMNPDHALVLFDSETGTKNKKTQKPEYKTNRPKVDESIYDQLSIIKRCLDLLKIKWIEDPKNEADDLIGTYSNAFSRCNQKVYICSEDHDFTQLVDNNTVLIRQHHGSNKVLDRAETKKRYGIYPHQYVDYLALKGDSSDNIKGIEGIGHTTASRLIRNHGSIENIYKSINSISSHIKIKLKNKKTFLNKQKKFLQIRLLESQLKTFQSEHYAFSKEMLPSKMGTFLKDNWNEIKNLQ